MEDWRKEIEFQRNVRVDIGFLVDQDFYYGPDNGFLLEQYKSMRVSLYHPEIKMSDNMVLYSNIIGKERELERYYLDVADKYKQYKKDITKSTHFWNRPVIYNSDFDINFPWIDRFRDGKNVLEHLASTTESEIYWDMDQSWALEVIGKNGLLYVREWDPDYDEIHCQVKFDWVSVRKQSLDLIPKVSNVIHELTIVLGRDYWT